MPTIVCSEYNIMSQDCYKPMHFWDQTSEPTYNTSQIMQAHSIFCKGGQDCCKLIHFENYTLWLVCSYLPLIQACFG